MNIALRIRFEDVRRIIPRTALFENRIMAYGGAESLFIFSYLVETFGGQIHSCMSGRNFILAIHLSLFRRIGLPQEVLSRFPEARPVSG